MNITTPSGVTLELRARQRAWQAITVLACVIGVVSIIIMALLVAVCSHLAGCAAEPAVTTAPPITLSWWQEAQRAATARTVAMYQANWQAGIYADELADQEEEY